MSEEQKRLFAKGLLTLANMLVAVVIVGLSVTENSTAAYVPVIGIATVAGLYAISYVIRAHHKEGDDVNQGMNQ
jgi:hypothetical protein